MILGQVQAIDRMIDEDIPCEDILAQINAAKSALHGCGKVVLEGHIRHCVRNGIEHGDADQTIASFSVISFIIYRQIFCYFGGQGTKGLKAPVNGFQYLIGAGFHPAVKKIQTSMVLYKRYG